MNCWYINSDTSKKTALHIDHDYVIKWFPVNSPHKGQWRGALMFSLICAWINDWVNNREAGDLRRYRGHYDVIVMYEFLFVGESVPLNCPADSLGELYMGIESL